MWLPLTILALACGSRAPEPAPAPPFALVQHAEALVELELPDSNLPGGEPAPEALPLQGPYEPGWASDGLQEYSTPLPVFQVFYGHTSRKAPPGMRLLDASGQPLKYSHDRTKYTDRTTWRVSRGAVHLRPGKGGAAPEPGTLTLDYPPAAQWENDLDPGASQKKGTGFALRQVFMDGDGWQGLLLPAPGRATWELTLPAGAILDMEARVMPHAVDRGQASDGAVLRVELTTDSGTTLLERETVGTSSWRHRRLDLSQWGGQRVRLTISSEPGGDNVLDFLFLANPTVYTPKKHPRRVALIFVDTLRSDHLGLYGHERATSPELDAWSARQVVFEQARSVSPWTLPAARSVLSGHPAGSWGQHIDLPQRLAQAGFHTGSFVCNAYLTRHFEMGLHWSEYRYRLLRPAKDQVDLVEDFLERNHDRDAALLVQFMEPHLPYNEPASYEHIWAGERPEELAGKMNRKELRRIRASKERKAELGSYMMDRYDQNIRVVDDQLPRLLAALGEDATVVFFGDHGEEFWEHGGIEHGHTLYDELLRVPLIIASKGLAPARVAEPVSLLDVTPTLLELLGLPADEHSTGRSLLPLMSAASAGPEPPPARSLYFGELLYGNEAWGVLGPDGKKWIAQGGRQQVFDLRSDPLETNDLVRQQAADLSPYAGQLSEALGQQVVPVWRIAGRGGGRVVVGFKGSVELSHPAGLEKAWFPPSLMGDTAPVTIQDGVLRVETSEGTYLPREIFVIPAGDVLDPEGLRLVVRTADSEHSASWRPRSKVHGLTDGKLHMLLATGEGDGRLTVGLHQAPLPPEQAAATSTTDEAATDALQALGYIDGDDPDD